MAGRLLVASRPSGHRPLKRRRPGRQKRAPGHDGNESVNVIAAWHQFYTGRNERPAVNEPPCHGEMRSAVAIFR